MPDLKNCPMCGSDRVDIITGNFVSATDDFKAGQAFAKVWCKRCQVRTGPEKSRAKAAEAWNNRTQPEGALATIQKTMDHWAQHEPGICKSPEYTDIMMALERGEG
jgi:Lar family restriction alleviation protein